MATEQLGPLCAPPLELLEVAIELSDDASVLQIACRELGIDFQPSADHFELAMQLTNLLNGSARSC